MSTDTPTPSLLDQVRETTRWVVERSRHVSLDNEAIQRLADEILDRRVRLADWDPTFHYTGPAELTAQYLLVLDALNFCFWPAPGWQYERLARALADAMTTHPEHFIAETLARVTPTHLNDWLGGDPPLVHERARLVREVGLGLLEGFDGLASNVVRRAGGSAARLAALLVRHFPGFQDHAIYGGRQVFLYKRAQIFAADIWGAFGGAGLGAFEDIHQLTTFADYRVPQLLVSAGVIVYDPALAARIQAERPIPAGSADEVEIRAATVQAVERLRDALAARGQAWPAVQVDWLLWHEGEARRDALGAHHRTLTIYY